jgi:ABC-2 type transport system ATP-binding protein
VDHLLTARENLVLMGELRHVADARQTAADLLDRFDLNEAADRRLLTFSGGMRRRLDIAMSLVGDYPATGRRRHHHLPDHAVPGGSRPSRG